jgi:hypothetical protein
MQQTWSGTTEVAEYALVIVECIVGWEALRAAGSVPPQEARQAHERVAIAADRLQRHVTELAGRLDRMAELTSTAPRRPSTRPAGHCS